MYILTLLLILLLYFWGAVECRKAQPDLSCPPRCQCYADTIPGSSALHLVCKWEQINSTNLATLRYPDQVRTLTIRCSHHNRKPSRPADRLFEGLRRLDRLEIDRCIMDRLPPGLFAGMSQLVSLVIKNAKLPDIPQGIFDYIPNLMTLDLSGSDLTIEPYALRSLHNLIHLDLSNNSLNFLANTLGSMTKLRVLSLDYNKLTNIDFRRLPSELTDLSIRSNLITTVHYIGTSGGGANTLLRLDLSGNKIDFVSGRGYINIFPPSLKQLDLSHNRIGLVQDLAMQQMKKMLLLDLSFNELTDVRESSFVGPEQKLKLFLRENPLKCSCSLQWLLRGIKIGGNSISIEDLQYIACTDLVDEGRRMNLTVADYRNELLCKYSTYCDNSTCTCCDDFICDCKSTCPAGCLCYSSSTQGEKAHNVLQCNDLRGTRLSEIPRFTTTLSLAGAKKSWDSEKIGRLDHLHTLNISSADVAEVSESALTGYPKLRVLDISSNELHSIPVRLPSHVHHLRIAGNPLRDFTDSEILILNQLHTITLGGNRTSFLCDCENPTSLQRWIRRNRKKVSDISSVQCDLAGVGIVSMIEVLPGRHSLCDNLTDIEIGFHPSFPPTGSSFGAGSSGIQMAPNTLHPVLEVSSSNSMDEDISIGEGLGPSQSVSPDIDTIQKMKEVVPPVQHKTSSTSMIYPTSIIKKTSTTSYNSARLTPKFVIFEDELPYTPERSRTSSSESTTKSSTPQKTRPTKTPRRGRHDRDHHRIVNALVFILFLCVMILVVAIGFTLYLRFNRSDVEIVRSTSFEAEPLNR